jgi:hypothetical protein
LGGPHDKHGITLIFIENLNNAPKIAGQSESSTVWRDGAEFNRFSSRFR